MINYSIIIPHKEIPDLLQRCLDTIPRREDVQIIVIDDNSRVCDGNQATITDNNEVVYPELVEKYPYVEWVWAKNEKGRKGAGYARNLGLERARGKWLIFADADDFFNPCFNEALDKYSNDENDIIFFYVNCVDSETLEKSNSLDYRNNFLDKAVSINRWENLLHLTVPWGKFIKKTLVDVFNIVFPEIICSEDVLFSYKSTYYTYNKVAIKPDCIYTLTERVNSLTKEIQGDKYKLTVRMEACCDAYMFLKSKNIINDLTLLRCRFCVEAWREIFSMNKLYALLVLLKSFTKKKFREIFVAIFENAHPSIKKYRLWKILRKI